MSKKDKTGDHYNPPTITTPEPPKEPGLPPLIVSLTQLQRGALEAVVRGHIVRVDTSATPIRVQLPEGLPLGEISPEDEASVRARCLGNGVVEFVQMTEPLVCRVRVAG